jgi:hypothetical protein
MPFIVITLLLLLMGCLCLCGSKLENKAYHRAKSKLQESVRPVYAVIERECQSFSNKYHKPEDYRTLNLFSGEKVDCWKNSNSLYILSDTGQLDRILNEMGNLVCDGDTSLVTEYMIPMTSIQYFRVDGDFYRENKISGGGGGGVNIKGALIGHLLAGNAGAIIGSRRKVEAIKSELIVHDDRKVILYYLADENAQQLSELVFDYGDYNELLKLIPEKEYNTAIAQMSAASNVQETAPVDQSSIKERLLELKSLKDEGLISTSEFEKKKEELLKSL